MKNNYEFKLNQRGKKSQFQQLKLYERNRKFTIFKKKSFCSVIDDDNFKILNFPPKIEKNRIV